MTLPRYGPYRLGSSLIDDCDLSAMLPGRLTPWQCSTIVRSQDLVDFNICAARGERFYSSPVALGLNVGFVNVAKRLCWVYCCVVWMCLLKMWFWSKFFLFVVCEIIFIIILILIKIRCLLGRYRFWISYLFHNWYLLILKSLSS